MLEKDNVFGDYAAFLKALLPQAQGFFCHDRHGRVFWSESPPDGAPALTDSYRSVVNDLLRCVAGADAAARLNIGNHVAYVMPLAGEGDSRLGALTVLVDRRDANMPYAFVADVLNPALRSLQRELFLRLRLVDSQRKLNVQAAEERLLHQVERILHKTQACEAALLHILELCREYLGVAGAVLAIPGKSITLVSGTALTATEVELICGRLLEQARDPAFDPDEAADRDGPIWVPVHQRAGAAEGIFALIGPDKSDFSERRLVRVARYVGTHIDSLMDRNFDPLTGLIAWPVCEQLLATAIREAGDRLCTVMCLNVDQLHVVNESLGREAGDEVLVRFATLLREALAGHLVSRVSGDNFVALLRDIDVDDARTIGEAICARMRENAFVREGQTFRPTVSIGIGPAGRDDADSPGGVLSYAQVACKAAKERGRGRVEVFESADVSIVRRVDDIQMVGYVRNAIENSRLVLMAQRLMPLKTGRVPNYFEVLVRIVDDAGRHVPPAEFISAAERYQLMEELDRWVVAQTLELIATRGPKLRGGAARFAINLSGQSLGSDSFLPFVETAIASAGVAPDLITFEITESVAVARMQQAQAFMHSLRKVGCRFSLDDFGTGLSSFGYLKLFPVDTLKIDGSFIRDIATNVVSQSVVAAIAEVARVMQLETVAEYVHDEAALELLRNLNISYAQGYLVGAAEPLQDKIVAANQVAAAGKKSSATTSG
jgi:diguanylate cyclase (GGDEF)-like protein